MAVYFDHRVEAPDSSNVPSQVTWHSSLPVLAVASISPTTRGHVDLYLQQVSTGAFLLITGTLCCIHYYSLPVNILKYLTVCVLSPCPSAGRVCAQLPCRTASPAHGAALASREARVGAGLGERGGGAADAPLWRANAASQHTCSLHHAAGVEQLGQPPGHRRSGE